MSAHAADRLVYMANQIADFFRSQPGGTAALKVADHLISFWDPSMRRAIQAHLQAGGEGLSPLAREAVALLEAGPRGAKRAALAKVGETTARAPGDDAG